MMIDHVFRTELRKIAEKKDGHLSTLPNFSLFAVLIISFLNIE